jgi:hypothetical protein
VHEYPSVNSSDSRTAPRTACTSMSAQPLARTLLHASSQEQAELDGAPLPPAPGIAFDRAPSVDSVAVRTSAGDDTISDRRCRCPSTKAKETRCPSATARHSHRHHGHRCAARRHGHHRADVQARPACLASPPSPHPRRAPRAPYTATCLPKHPRRGGQPQSSSIFAHE